MRILIADDERIIRSGMRMVIEKADPRWEITETVANGTEALASIKNNIPDVLITDIRMPDMDGIALSKAARRLVPELIILVVSGYSDFEFAKEAIRFGALDYLLKPTDPRDMIRALKKAEKELDKRQKRELEEQLARLPEDGLEPALAETATRKVIRDALHYIQKNYTRNISLKHIAQLFSMNPDYFSYLFKRQTGINFSEYLTNYRIHEAERILKSDLNVKTYEVAEKVGFGSSKYFAKVFKDVTGFTPTGYREQSGRQEEKNDGR
jgi:two-component system, response regulator YesN